jgi:hypothetical protein
LTRIYNEEQSISAEALSTVDEKLFEIKNLYRRFGGLEQIRHELLFFKAGTANIQMEDREYILNEL